MLSSKWWIDALTWDQGGGNMVVRKTVQEDDGETHSHERTVQRRWVKTGAFSLPPVVQAWISICRLATHSLAFLLTSHSQLLVNCSKREKGYCTKPQIKIKKKQSRERCSASSANWPSSFLPPSWDTSSPAVSFSSWCHQCSASNRTSHTHNTSETLSSKSLPRGLICLLSELNGKGEDCFHLKWETTGSLLLTM